MHSSLICAAATATLVLGLSTAASASTPALPPSVSITYSQAELATDAGALEVYRRIAAAARKVCPAQDGTSLLELAVSRDCQRAAIARAIAQVPQTRLVAIAARRANRG